MPRIRSIKPDLCADTKVARVSEEAELMWVKLWTHSDDDGRFLADADDVLATVYAARRSITAEQVEERLGELAREGLIRLYEAEGRRLGVVPKFRKHQKISHPVASQLPAPPESSGALRRSRDSAGLARARGTRSDPFQSRSRSLSFSGRGTGGNRTCRNGTRPPRRLGPPPRRRPRRRAPRGVALRRSRLRGVVPPTPPAPVESLRRVGARAPRSRRGHRRHGGSDGLDRGGRDRPGAGELRRRSVRRDVGFPAGIARDEMGRVLRPARDPASEGRNAPVPAARRARQRPGRPTRPRGGEWLTTRRRSRACCPTLPP